GLTAADIVGTLRAQGHRGRITLVSRHGLRSRGHAPAGQAAVPRGDFVSRPATTALALLRRVRAEVRAAADEGLTWHPVFDALRLQGGAIWRALSIAERRRLVRHLRSFWDVHRFRIAPQLDELLVAELTAGRVEHVAGRVVGAAAEPGGGFAVEIRLRAGGTVVRRRFGALIVATGPAHGTVLASQPHLEGLAAAGVLKPDPIGLGIACDDGARALRADGKAEPDLFVAGPLARGTFGELMGLPQVTDHAVLVATAVARLVRPSTAAA
ncbi:FAD/NAD(P)-binding protein, partial [Oharaeibacter diazotrophicus]